MRLFWARGRTSSWYLCIESYDPTQLSLSLQARDEWLFTAEERTHNFVGSSETLTHGTMLRCDTQHSPVGQCPRPYEGPSITWCG